MGKRPIRTLNPELSTRFRGKVNQQLAFACFSNLRDFEGVLIDVKFDESLRQFAEFRRRNGIHFNAFAFEVLAPRIRLFRRTCWQIPFFDLPISNRNSRERQVSVRCELT